VIDDPTSLTHDERSAFDQACSDCGFEPTEFALTVAADASGARGVTLLHMRSRVTRHYAGPAWVDAVLGDMRAGAFEVDGRLD